MNATGPGISNGYDCPEGCTGSADKCAVCDVTVSMASGLREGVDKRVECSASVFGLLVAIGPAPFALAPLCAEVRAVLDHECARSAGVDVPREQPAAQEDAP